MRMVTNNACAISRLVVPSAAMPATRRSLGVSASTPVRMIAPRARTGGQKLLARALDESPGAAGVRELHPGVQRFAGLGAPAGPPDRAAELDERARVLEAPRGWGERGEALAQQSQAVITAAQEADHPQRSADRAGRPYPPRELELLRSESVRAVTSPWAARVRASSVRQKNAAGLSARHLRSRRASASRSAAASV